MDKLTQKGLKRFVREAVEINGLLVHKRLNLYVDIGEKCNASCGFCIARTLNRDHRVRNLECMLESARRILPYCFSVEFVGGEPLVYLNNGLKQLLEMFKDTRKKIITTNGLRVPFLESMDFLIGFDHINISRHSLSDADNERVFKTSHLLTLSDMEALPESLKRKVRMNVTCHREGIETADAMWKFVSRFRALGVSQFMFANLNKLPMGFYDPAVEAFTAANRLDNQAFDQFDRHLQAHGFRKIREMTGFGYKVRILHDGSASIVLKENDDTNIRALLDSIYTRNRVLLDLVLTPSGKVYTDWFLTNEFRA